MLRGGFLPVVVGHVFLVMPGIATAQAAREVAPAAAVAEDRLDEDGFPRWPLFDDRAAADIFGMPRCGRMRSPNTGAGRAAALAAGGFGFCGRGAGGIVG